MAQVAKAPFVRGVCLWSWSPRLYTVQEAAAHRGYEIYLKPAEKVVVNFFGEYGR